jgi:hypothetical protein
MEGQVLVGCKHNYRRKIVYPGQVMANDLEIFRVGDSIALVCPEGCPDLNVEIVVKSRAPRRKPTVKIGESGRAI